MGCGASSSALATSPVPIPSSQPIKKEVDANIGNIKGDSIPSAVDDNKQSAAAVGQGPGAAPQANQDQPAANAKATPGGVSQDMYKALSSPEPPALMQAVKALQEGLTGCRVALPDILQHNVTQQLVEAVQRSDLGDDSLGNSCVILAVLAHVTSLSPETQAAAIQQAAVPFLVQKVATAVERVSYPACACLAQLVHDATAAEQVVAAGPVAATALTRITAWIVEPVGAHTSPALNVIGGLCGGSETCTQICIDAGAIPALLTLLNNPCANETHIKESVWCLSNIAAGTTTQVQALVNAGAFKTINAKLATANEDLARECTYVLANPWQTALSADTAGALVANGVVKSLLSLADASKPAGICLLALEGIADAIKRGQNVMREKMKAQQAQQDGGPNVPVPTNVVTDELKGLSALEAMEILVNKMGHDGEITAKASTIANMLRFL